MKRSAVPGLRGRAAQQDRRFVTALARGLDILRCFSRKDRELGNTEIAARTNQVVYIARLKTDAIELLLESGSDDDIVKLLRLLSKDATTRSVKPVAWAGAAVTVATPRARLSHRSPRNSAAGNRPAGT